MPMMQVEEQHVSGEPNAAITTSPPGLARRRGSRSGYNVEGQLWRKAAVREVLSNEMFSADVLLAVGDLISADGGLADREGLLAPKIGCRQFCRTGVRPPLPDHN
jgi:hypothetical protein